MAEVKKHHPVGTVQKSVRHAGIYRLGFVGFLIAAFAFAGCKDKSGLENTFSVSGLVKDDQGKTVSQAEVTLTNLSGAPEGPRSQFTTSSGTYAFNEVRGGRYTLRFRKTGFETAIETLQVSTPLINRITGLTGLKGSVAGTVSVTGTASSEGVTIRALRDTVLIAQTVTGADGRFVFEKLGTGTFRIRAIRAEFNTVERTVNLTAGGVVNVSFTLIRALPSVSTAAVHSIGTTQASSGGNVASGGATTVTARGVCWSATNELPTISDARTNNGNSLGAFTSNLSGLAPNTTYFVRAYATNSAGTAYGKALTFKTEPSSGLAILTTAAVTGVTSTGAISGGNISSQGTGSVMQRGVCWSTRSNPTIADNRTNDGTGGGAFQSVISGLVPGVTYFARAYATNNAGTAYGNEVSFATAATEKPSVTTAVPSNIKQNAATGGGTVISSGSFPVLSRGLVWAGTRNPSLSSFRVISGSGTGSFTAAISGLKADTVYYVRAYAITARDTVFGDERSFRTQKHVFSFTACGTTDVSINLAKRESRGTLCASNITDSELQLAIERVEVRYLVYHDTTAVTTQTGARITGDTGPGKLQSMRIRAKVFTTSNTFTGYFMQFAPPVPQNPNTWSSESPQIVSWQAVFVTATGASVPEATSRAILSKGVKLGDLSFTRVNNLVRPIP